MPPVETPSKLRSAPGPFPKVGPAPRSGETQTGQTVEQVSEVGIRRRSHLPQPLRLMRAANSRGSSDVGFSFRSEMMRSPMRAATSAATSSAICRARC